jgi:hypothetical protein
MAFRRITYHRSWFMIVVGTIGLASIVGNWIAQDNLSHDLVSLAAFGTVITTLMIVRGFTGEWGQRQLRVDVAGGKLKLPDGSLRDLDQLGALTIEKKLLPRSNNPRMQTRIHEYRLRAANVEYYLYDSVYESETLLRFKAVDTATLQFQLRRVLERPSGDGAFRSAPDAAPELLEIAGTRERLVEGLTALAKTDPDRQIRAAATERLARA